MSQDTRAAARGLADLQPVEAAVFLDFDGVLVDLASHPDGVEVRPAALPVIAALEDRTGGARAIVTGREIEDLRRHLPRVPKSVIGAHGAELQLAGVSHAVAEPVSDRLRAVQMRALRATSQPGIMVERKSTGAAIHFRNAPELADDIRAFCNAIVAEIPGFEVLAARCVFEISPQGVGKDKAVAEAMAIAPFAGRVPVCIGDDVTDEPALAWVAEQGGVAINVGPGDSVAPHRLDDPAEVLAALAGWLDDGFGTPGAMA